MKIKVFLSSASSIAEKELLKTFASGIETWIENSRPDHLRHIEVVRTGRWEKLGGAEHWLEYEHGDAYSACDVAVIFGSWKPREKGHHLIRSSVASQAKKFLVIETPLINRSTSSENTAWRIGVNGFLNRDADWAKLADFEADRKLQAMGVSWQGWRNNPDGHILLALQLPGDASLRGADINDWAFRTIHQIRSVTDRAIVVRNHPLCSQRAFADHEELGRRLLLGGYNKIKFSDGQLSSWQADLEGAYCTVTYSSGLAVDSVLSGIPTVACDPGNFAWGISVNKPEKIEALEYHDSDVMQTWLRQLVACQWTVEEMESGQAWESLLTTLEECSL